MPDRLTKRLGQSPKRIAVFRALQLGDLLVTAPVFRAIRRNFPTADVALVGLPWAREFVARFSRFIDGFLEFPGYPGLPERQPNLAAYARFVRHAEARHFDVAIQLHGSGTVVNEIVYRLGAKVVCGFFESESACPDPELFTRYPSGNEILRNLKLLEFLELPCAGTHLEFPIHEGDRREFAQLKRAYGLGKYVCIHAGARYASRRWPAERFAAVADRLSAAGFQIVLTGSQEECELAADVGRRMSRPHLNLAGHTSLGALAVMSQQSQLLITNDTGVSHVAAAVKAPSVVIVLGSDAARWAPLNRQLHAVVCEPIDCRPCDHRVCPIGHPCATSIDVDRVLTAARTQLGYASHALHQGIPRRHAPTEPSAMTRKIKHSVSPGGSM
jgi:ADP-heptose:LPS heptosyltransferase